MAFVNPRARILATQRPPTQVPGMPPGAAAPPLPATAPPPPATSAQGQPAQQGGMAQMLPHIRARMEKALGRAQQGSAWRPPAAPGAAPAPMAGPTPAPATPTAPDLNADVRSGLQQLIARGREPIDMERSPEAEAYRRVQQRELMENRAQLAESAGRTGQISGRGEMGGGVQGEIAQGQEGLAERMQAMQSQLVGRELQSRRDQLMSALQMGSGVMGRDQEGVLRRELAALDATLQREGRASSEMMQGRGIAASGSQAAMQRALMRDQMEQEREYQEAQLGQGRGLFQ